MPTARDGRRILRSNPSLSSLASSLSSLYTSTSSSTQWGPGALAGKAILALGKATLRGAERLVIFRRMVAIKTHLPCLDDERSGADTCFMDGIFDDLVELSRPELYPESIRQPAMELILAQIASGHTTYLINSLSQWLPDDLIVLIAEIIYISMFCRDGFLEGRLSNAYVFALPEGRHPLGPCTSFLSELARQNETTFEAVIMSKFLDMVLLSSRKHATEPGHFDEETQSSFSTAFAVLSTPSCQSYELWMVNLEQYWPFVYHPSLAEVVQHINKTSPGTWLLLEAHFLERKAHRMLELAMPCKYPMYSGRSVADVTYPRLKDFNLTSVVPPFQLQEILDSGLASSRALWHFLRCVALGGNVRSLMAEHLLSQSHRSRVSVFSRIIYLLIPNTRESRTKEMKNLCALIGGQNHLTSLFTKFLLELADFDVESRYALLDAVVTTIIPLLIPQIIDSSAIFEDLFRRSHFFPSIKRRPSYSKATLRLFGIIRENALASVIGQPGSKASRQIAEVLEPLFNA